jgi:hypothetical protein
MRLLQHDATNKTVIVAAVTGIRALVNKAAAGRSSTASNTKMVNPSQTKPS